MSESDQTQTMKTFSTQDGSRAEEMLYPKAILQSPGRVREYLAALGQLHLSVTSPLLSIIVFGSAAEAGFASETSDVDLIVVLPDSASREDRDRVRHELLALEMAHGFRSPTDGARSWLERFAGRAAGHAMSCFVCTRSDLFSGDVGRVLDLWPIEAMLVDRIVLASVIVSAVTIWGEELLPQVPIRPIRRLDVFKALFNFAGVMAMNVAAFPLLPEATQYATGILKHSVHSCYFCYHLKSAPLEEEVLFFRQPLRHQKTLQELLERRRTSGRSFAFVLRCLPVLFRLHLRTARDHQFPRSAIRTDLKG